jgi:hypothetical protein
MTYTHHLELQVITVLFLIFTLHSSLQHPPSFSNLLCVNQPFPDNGFMDILQLPSLRSSCHSRLCRSPVSSLNCELSTLELDSQLSTANPQLSLRHPTAISRDYLNHLPTPEISIQFSAATANYLIVISSQLSSTADSQVTLSWPGILVNVALGRTQ